jgi:glutamate formiminotransferase/formiminotetrahydrofolate cyclodeaminase
MLEAGRYFLRKQQRSLGVSDRELIKIAVKSLGLNDLYEFRPEEKIIEYRIMQTNDSLLKNKSVEEFIFETASESPAPGGGSVSACIGSLGAALGTMVANLSAHKRGWDERWEEFSDWAEKGKKYQEELLSLIDQDTAAFNALLEAFSLPGSSEEEKASRNEQIEQAAKNAIIVPFRAMEVATAAMELVRAMAETGNPNSITDAGVGAMALRSCVKGAFLNVKINLPSLHNPEFAGEILKKGNVLQKKAEKAEKEILALIEAKLS